MFHAPLSEYYGSSDFFNFGFWDNDTADQKTACENLIEKLVSFLPSTNGKILDVACGKGASTEFLLRYYAPQNLTGLNISSKQLKSCKTKVPEANFLLMDAVDLDFESNSFDNIICVEAVFHFNTREKFLKEAYRVLKPGGCLILTDILLTDWGKRNNLWWIHKNNYDLNDLRAYKRLYENVGFSGINIVDATQECWESHLKSIARYSHEKFSAGEIDTKTYQAIALRQFGVIPFIKYYLLTAVVKDKTDGQ
jgi:ubiquinone/menaquinone biosynthesis C-methylase UbiE